MVLQCVASFVGVACGGDLLFEPGICGDTVNQGREASVCGDDIRSMPGKWSFFSPCASTDNLCASSDDTQKTAEQQHADHSFGQG